MTLPAPLQEGVDYYVLNSDSTHIQLAESEGGSPIDITDTGSSGGSFQITRQGTAEYKLELENSCGGVKLSQLPMAVDASGGIQPSSLSDNNDVGDGGIGWNSDYSYLILGYCHWIGNYSTQNYIYSVQRSRINRKLNICLWAFWSVETSHALLEFGSESTKFTGMIYTKNNSEGGYNNKILIGTNDGIYVFDPINVSVNLLTTSDIIGMIDNNIKDIVYLENEDCFWTGHETGLTKIRISDLFSWQYLNAPGARLQGLDAGDEFIRYGSMSIAHGETDGSVRILVGGHGGDLENHSYANTWMLEEIYGLPNGPVCPFLGVVNSCALKDSSNQIIVHDTNVYTIRVRMFTLQYSSSWQLTLLHSVNAAARDYYGITTQFMQMTQISDKDFIFYALYDTGSNTAGAFMVYREYDGMVSTTIFGESIGGQPGYLDGWRYAFTRYKMHAAKDEVGNTVDFIVDSSLNAISLPIGNPILLGFDDQTYNPGKWVIEKDRNGPDTKKSVKLKSTGSFIDDIVMSANNAFGKPWDEQFIATERFTFMYGDMKFKDNLQTMLFRGRSYYSNAYESVNFFPPPSLPNTFQVPEATSDPNFREVDNYDLVNTVIELVPPNGLYYAQYKLPDPVTFTADIDTSILSVGADIPTGTPVYLSVSNWRINRLPLPLRYGGIYFAINVDSTSIRLALSQAGALSGIYITLLYVGVGTLKYQIVAPTSKTYFLGLNGIFIFSQDDVGESNAVAIRYTVTTYN